MRRTFREARLSSISDTQADRVAAGALRARIAELRAALVEAEGNCERLAREAEMRVERLGKIAHDHAGWSTRLSDAQGQIVELDARREQIAGAIAKLAAKPGELETKKMALGDEIAKAEHNRQHLVHERETMGAVNLRAEEEANELEQQITGMTAERDDLVAAIGRLRQGIQSLNREGRERFLAAFEQVSGHFQQLFTKLFGGGKAELRLT